MKSAPSLTPSKHPPTIKDIYAATEQIRDKIVRTPLLESQSLNARLGGRLLVKAEPLQRTGSFKFRGAYNKLSRIPTSELAKGVVTFSSGNHAQGIASVAQILGTSATIIMPEDAPKIKVINTESYGAKILTYKRNGSTDREALARDFSTKHGALLVSPFDDPNIIAGQGTIGLEVAEQASELGAELDMILVPCGGGGLVSGIAIALKTECPNITVYAVEPIGFDSMTRSIATGRPSGNRPGAHSICDALQPPRTGDFTFEICKKYLTGGITLDDNAVKRAMRVAFNEFKLVVEPGGCIALAAALENKLNIKDRNVAVICSGGNVDPNVFTNAIRT